MKVVLLLALGLLLVSCGEPAAATDVAGAARRYLALPDRALIVVGRRVRDEEKRQELRDLADACCTGQLKLSLMDWFSGASMNSESFFDDIQSMRPVGVPICRAPVRVDERRATMICQFETAEGYSLARNLENLADLYKEFDIRNMTLAEASSEIRSQKVPEVVEIVVHVQKTANLHLLAIDGNWLVSDARLSAGEARIEVRIPK